MTPEARLSAAIEIVDAIIAAAREGGPSGDAIVSQYFRTRRYAGAKDRRAVREWVWRAIRTFGDAPQSGRSSFVALADTDPSIAALFTGTGHAPAPIAPDEDRAKFGAIPQWISTQFAQPVGGIDTDALIGRAPLDIRVNGLKTNRESAAVQFPTSIILPETPFGLRLPTGSAIDGHPAFQNGMVEIQDYGSQLIAQACAARAGQTVLDLCAGAGGKTLALATDMMGEGRLIAADTSRTRLGELPKRATRAGAKVEARLLNGGREAEELADLRQACDVVLVDAPCSGTGTWRRNPETRWRLTPARLEQLVTTQAKLLDIGADLVNVGGALVYAVCALTEAEGAAQVTKFLKRRTDFIADVIPFAAGRSYGPGRILTPCHDGSDGFYLARLKRIG